MNENLNFFKVFYDYIKLLTINNLFVFVFIFKLRLYNFYLNFKDKIIFNLLTQKE